MRRMSRAVWLWQAKPRCGRSCRDEPISAGVEMRRPGAAAADEAADGVAAMSRFRLVWECAGRGRLRQTKPRTGLLR